MDEPDLAGIDPARLPEVRRRLRLVRGYIAGRRTAAERASAAAELGVSVGQFMRLVRAWLEHGEAKRLHGAGRPQGQPRRSDRMTPAVRAVLEEALKRTGPTTRAADLLADVRSHCRTLDLDPPAGSTVHCHLQRSRETTGAIPEIPAAIVVAPCQLRFAVRSAESVGRATALIAATQPKGFVVAAVIGMDGETPASLSAVTDGIAAHSTAGAARRPVLVHPRALGGAATADRATIDVAPSGSAGLALSAMLGGRLGTLRIVFGAQSDRDLRQQGRSRLNRPVPLADAGLALAAAVDAHNAARGGTPAYAVESAPADRC